MGFGKHAVFIIRWDVIISLRDRFLSSFFLEKETYDRVRLTRMIYVTVMCTRFGRSQFTHYETHKRENVRRGRALASLEDDVMPIRTFGLINNNYNRIIKRKSAFGNKNISRVLRFQCF